MEYDANQGARRLGRIGRAAAWAAVLAVVGVVLWFFLRPQPAPSVPIGIAVVQLSAVDAVTFEGFKQGLADLGFAADARVQYRYPAPAGEVEGLPATVDEALGPGVDLVFSSSTPATQAVQAATAASGTPVVFCPVNDPLGAGVVESLAAPGGNLTGIRLPEGDELRLQRLLEVAPHMHRFLLPFNPKDASSRASGERAAAAAERLGLEPILYEVTDQPAIGRLLTGPPEGIEAVFLPRDSMIESRIDEFVAFALRHRLPLSAPAVAQVRAGALMSYGFDHFEMGRQAARMAAQVLNGVPPAELPVETAHNYLALNLDTARRIGLELSPHLLRQADVLVR